MGSFILNLISIFGYPILIIGEALEGMGIPFPGETFLITAAVYAGASGNLSLPLIILFSTIGSFLGDNLGYYIGLKKGYALLIQHGHRVGLTTDHLEKAQKYFKRYGSLTVFIGRFTALLRIFSPLLAGMNKMPYMQFVIANFFGCFLWSTVYAILGYALGNNLPLLHKVLRFVGLDFTALIIIILLGIALYYYYKSKRK